MIEGEFFLILFILTGILGMLLIIYTGILKYCGAFLIAFSLSISALFIFPSYASDLNRYFLIMGKISNISLFTQLYQSFKQLPELEYQSNSMLFNCIEWIISRTGYFSLITGLVVLVTYFLTWLPILHQVINHKDNFWASLFFLLVIFFLLPYAYVGSMLRWFLAVSITFFNAYLLVVCNKKFLVTAQFLIPIFIHPGVVLPIFLIVMNYFLSGKLKHSLFIIEVVILVMFFYLLSTGYLNFISGLTSSNPLAMAEGYSENFLAFNRNGFLALIVKVSICMLYGISSIILVRDNKDNLEDNELKKMNSINLGFIFISLALLPKILLLDRYIVFVGLFSVLVFVYINQRNGFISNTVKFFYLLAFVMSIIQFFVLFHGLQFVPYIQYYG